MAYTFLENQSELKKDIDKLENLLTQTINEPTRVSLNSLIAYDLIPQSVLQLFDNIYDLGQYNDPYYKSMTIINSSKFNHMLLSWENFKLRELKNEYMTMGASEILMIDQFNSMLLGNIDYVEHLIDQLLELLSKYVPSDLLSKLSIDIYEKENTSTYHYNYNLSQMSDKEVEEFRSFLRFYYAAELGITTNQFILILPYTINDLDENTSISKLLQEETRLYTSFSLNKSEKSIYHIPALLTIRPDGLSNHRLKGDDRSSLDIQEDQEEYQFIMQKRKGE